MRVGRSLFLSLRAFFSTASSIRYRRETRGKPPRPPTVRISRFFSRARESMTMLWKSFHYHLISASSHSLRFPMLPFRLRRVMPDTRCRVCPDDTQTISYAAHFYFAPLEFTVRAACTRGVGRAKCVIYIESRAFSGKNYVYRSG